MSDAFLDHASDVAFAKLEGVGGDPRRLEEPFRTVAVVCSAQGVIDNGGLRHFFENDWPAQPPYSLFSDAYRTIGAMPEAAAIEAGASALGFPEPERHASQRRSVLEGPGGERIEALDEELVSDAWKLLADYARANRGALAGTPR